MQNELFLTQKQAAIALHVSELTLWKWRRDGTGPQYSKIGRKIIYRQSALERYVRQRQVSQNSQQISEV